MKVKILVSYTLAFLFSITLFLIIACGSVVPLFKDEKTILSELEKQNYYERLSKDIEKEMKLDIISSGLPESVLDELFTKEMIKEEIENSLRKTYNNQNYEINTSQVEENLKKNIEKYLEKNNIVTTDEEALNEFVKETTLTYKSGINLYGYSKYIKSGIQKFKGPLTWGLMGLILIEIIIGLSILKFASEKHFGAICFTTAIFLFLLKIYITSHADINHLFLFNQFFSDTLKSIINGTLTRFTIIGIILLFMAIILSLLKAKRMSKIDD